MGIPGGDHILQHRQLERPEAVTSFKNASKSPSAGPHLALHPAIVLIDVEGPEHRPISGLPPQVGSSA